MRRLSAEQGAAPATRLPPMEGAWERDDLSPDEDDGPLRPGRPSSSSPTGTTTRCQELALRAGSTGAHAPALVWSARMEVWKRTPRRALV